MSPLSRNVPPSACAYQSMAWLYGARVFSHVRRTACFQQWSPAKRRSLLDKRLAGRWFQRGRNLRSDLCWCRAPPIISAAATRSRVSRSARISAVADKGAVFQRLAASVSLMRSCTGLPMIVICQLVELEGLVVVVIGSGGSTDGVADFVPCAVMMRIGSSGKHSRRALPSAYRPSPHPQVGTAHRSAVWRELQRPLPEDTATVSAMIAESIAQRYWPFQVVIDDKNAGTERSHHGIPFSYRLRQ